ncbi:M61 family metallopeptidase [Sulfobacillus harzensis]|uniref:M61 family metallopeptidase n=1 Tax=Sulfobacillus harzensis TaxID=2729629 RepID=A0A7Y0L1M6_9FIRM|nr:PDZ domain-containing protein [Sulfobacillus harzensis]NMP21367.1 M61 family metallopeptidase [Sulfobacillus harzensis]
MSTPSFRFTVDCRKPGYHVYHMTLNASGLAAGRHTLTLPVWTPGAYEVQDFARHVFDMAITVADKPVEVYHLSKNQWGFDTYGESSDATITYKVYAFELGVDTSHLDQSHAYFNGAQLFFLVDDFKDAPYDVEIQAPPGWHVSTGLDSVNQDPYHFRARDYDILIDSPAEIGTHRVLSFTVDQKPHHLAIWGHGNEDAEKLLADVEEIVKAQRDLFGGLPYDHYTFILHLSDRGTGGLEHLNSTTCGTGRFAYRPRKKYRHVLQLISHEFFHLWNVKRIHPEMLGPFDYNREVYTRLLWAMEGFTDYFATLALRYANLFTADEYLKNLGDNIKAYEKKPGRFVQSLAESSFDTWIKLYKPDADSPNRTISYYLKGDLVGTCLDLEIRKRTNLRYGLDEVLRRLYDRYAAHGIGFPESVYQETVEEVVEGSMEDFFQKYINGTAPVPFDQFLGYAGLKLERTYKNPDQEDQEGEGPDKSQTSSPLAWLGVDAALNDAKDLVVKFSYTDGPAAETLNPGDHILAVNGYQVKTEADLKDRISVDHAIGDPVEVTVFRRGHLETLSIVLGTAPPDEVKIIPQDDAREDQKALYQNWLRVPWKAAKHH